MKKIAVLKNLSSPSKLLPSYFFSCTILTTGVSSIVCLRFLISFIVMIIGDFEIRGKTKERKYGTKTPFTNGREEIKKNPNIDL